MIKYSTYLCVVYNMKTMESLTKVELEIMEYLWILGKASASDIIQYKNDDSIPHSTISSVLRILERKGYVDFEQRGRAYVYFPLVEKKEYGKKSLKSVLSSFFNNSPKELVSFLIQEQEISKKDLDKLQQQINQLKNK